MQINKLIGRKIYRIYYLSGSVSNKVLRNTIHEFKGKALEGIRDIWD